jgi:LacI family transcriptional regulator
MPPPQTNLRQIAKALGLSVTTVSRALKDGPEVRPETRAKVQAAAKAAGYVPNLRGLALKTGRTHMLSVVLPLETTHELSDLARLPLIEGMTRAAQSLGYTLNIQSAIPDEDPLQSIRKIAQLGASDGIIVTRMAQNDARLTWLTDSGIPFVSFGRAGPDDAHAFIDIDNHLIAEEATAYLLGRGHKRIALQVLSVADVSSADRVSGYVNALSAAGFGKDGDLICSDGFSFSACEAATLRVLALPDPPTALICANEIGYLGALSALRKCPGRDLEIVTRDYTGLSGFLEKQVVTHSIDMANVGKHLVKALVTRIEDPSAPATQTVIAPTAFE